MIGDRIIGIPPAPLFLTAAGVVPFAAAAGVMLVAGGSDPVLAGQAGVWLSAYGAVILSFLGGVRWGAHMTNAAREAPGFLVLMLSVLGALVGWAAIGLGFFVGPGPWPFHLLTIGFILQGAWDLAGRTLPAWYRRLRIGATGAVVLILQIAAYAAR